MKRIVIALAFILCLTTNAFAACDVSKASADFVKFTQDLSDNNPDSFKKAQGELQKLAQEINKLAQSGEVDAICKKYEDFMKKF